MPCCNHLDVGLNNEWSCKSETAVARNLIYYNGENVAAIVSGFSSWSLATQQRLRLKFFMKFGFSLKFYSEHGPAILQILHHCRFKFYVLPLYNAIVVSIICLRTKAFLHGTCPAVFPPNKLNFTCQGFTHTAKREAANSNHLRLRADGIPKSRTGTS